MARYSDVSVGWVNSEEWHLRETVWHIVKKTVAVSPAPKRRRALTFVNLMNRHYGGGNHEEIGYEWNQSSEESTED